MNNQRRRRDPELNNRLLLLLPRQSDGRSKLKALANAARIGWDDTRYCLDQLRRLGLMQQRREVGYFLTPKGEQEVERLLRLTSEQPPSADAVEQRLWNAMCVKRKWALDELLALACRPDDDNPADLAIKYLQFLEAGGIVQRLPELKHLPPRWRLANLLGLIAPTIRPSQGWLYDWNSNQPISDQSGQALTRKRASSSTTSTGQVAS